MLLWGEEPVNKQERKDAADNDRPISRTLLPLYFWACPNPNRKSGIAKVEQILASIIPIRKAERGVFPENGQPRLLAG